MTKVSLDKSAISSNLIRGSWRCADQVFSPFSAYWVRWRRGADTVRWPDLIAARLISF